MIALVGAMFVAMGSVSAAPASQSVAPIPGNACVANPGIMLGFTDNCDLDVRHFDSAANGLVVSDGSADVIGVTSPNNDSVWRITATSLAGTKTVNVTAPDNTNKPDDADSTDDVVGSLEVTVVGFAFKSLAVKGDADRRVQAGTQVTVVATVHSPHADAVVRLTVPTTGLSLLGDGTGAGTGTSQSQTKDVPATSSEDPPAVTRGTVEFVVNTAGAPAGEYTLTFTADNDGEFTTTPSSPIPVEDPENEEAAAKVTRLENSKQVSQALTLEIGDVGVGLSSATLSLGNSVNDIPYTADNEAVAATKTAPASDGKINMVISAFDSLGGKTNNGLVNQVIVIAPGGSVSLATGSAGTLVSNLSGATITGVNQSTGIVVEKPGTKAGMVTVYAIVSGTGGAATTAPETLNFSGSTTSIAVADATDTLRSVNVDDNGNPSTAESDHDTVTLAVTGMDDGGIVSDPGASYVITITDPDGKGVNSNKIAAEVGDYAGGKRVLTVTGKGSQSSPLAAGEYTVTLKGSLEASGMFAVAGSAAHIDLTVDDDAPTAVGQGIMFTVRVTDKDDGSGNPVVDGTVVTITASDVRGDNDSVLVLALQGVDNNSGTVTTKDGEATGRLVAVGPGSAVVTASSGAGFAVVVIESTAGMVEPEAMPEEEASLSCLSSLSGFSTWTCDVEASASEIFDWISSRGATALHLNSNRMWVRYSVVDGAMVPGSSDFMVTKSDILYISN